MAAVAYPQQWERPELPAPVRLRPVARRPPRRRTPSLRPASRRQVYRRRRVAVLLLLAAAVPAGRTGVALLGGGPLTSPGPPPAAASPVYVVQPGDTLWGIAERLRPGADERPVVAALSAELRGSDPVPGEALSLP